MAEALVEFPRARVDGPCPEFVLSDRRAGSVPDTVHYSAQGVEWAGRGATALCDGGSPRTRDETARRRHPIVTVDAALPLPEPDGVVKRLRDAAVLEQESNEFNAVRDIVTAVLACWPVQ